MKKTANIIEAISTLTPRATLDKKEYKAFYNGVEEVLNTVYEVYRSRINGTSTAEAESKAMTEITNFLHTVGKVNGKYISVCEKTEENGNISTLFDNLVYHSFQDSIITTSVTLATLESKKKSASKAKAEAHKALVDGKGTAKAYKEAVKAYDEAVAKVKAEQQKPKAEKTIMQKAKKTVFTKFFILRLQSIIENRLALTKEEAEAQRKLRNKASKESRSKKADGKKAEAKKTA